MAKNRYREDDKFYISDFRVLIYVIGYACYGESAILLIMNGEEVYYSVVIDSFHYKAYKGGPFINKTVDILHQHHVKHLDLLCWTHPHDDHSRGICTLLNKFCDEDTNVLFPMYLENNSADIVKLKQVSKEIVDRLLEVNREGKVHANPIGVVEAGYNNVDEFEIVNTYNDEDVRTVSIDVLTPISNKLTSYVNDQLCPDPNELSISFVINIDDYGFYFGGDTTNKHIDASKVKKIGKCRFVKIPHHSSDTADHLLNYLDFERLDAVCTTVFCWGKSILPKSEVIRKYQNHFSEIFSTNRFFKKEDYGIIEYDYNFSCGYPSCEIRCQGNVGMLNFIQ